MTPQQGGKGKGRPPIPGRRGRPAEPRPRTAEEAAFDLWLTQSLHELYDSVTGEPIPPELLDALRRGRKDN